jgi:hypothetical protein
LITFSVSYVMILAFSIALNSGGDIPSRHLS